MRQYTQRDSERHAGWHGQSDPDLSDRPLTVSPPPPPPSGCSVTSLIQSSPAITFFFSVRRLALFSL